MSANAIKVIVNMRHIHVLKFSFNEQSTFGHSLSLYRLIIESCLLIKNTIHSSKEVHIMNEYIRRCRNIRIVIYGKNSNDESVFMEPSLTIAFTDNML